MQIPLRDTLLDSTARQELVAGGGQQMVPCLRIERADGVQWLYESQAIILYLTDILTKIRSAEDVK